MTTVTYKHKVVRKIQSPENGLGVLWLDDNANNDQSVKTMFQTLYQHVFTFNDGLSCLEVVESVESEEPTISILVSGKYGQMLVRNRFQPLKQVKHIYVYCYDVNKHKAWAQECDKVRIVDSDFKNIINCMKKDVSKDSGKDVSTDSGKDVSKDSGKAVSTDSGKDVSTDSGKAVSKDSGKAVSADSGKAVSKDSGKDVSTDSGKAVSADSGKAVLSEKQVEIDPHDETEIQVDEPQPFTADHNLLNQVALDLLISNSNDDKNAAAKDFIEYCQTNDKNKEGKTKKNIEDYFKPKLPTKHWFKDDLVYINFDSTDLLQLWKLRWFIRLFHEQLHSEYQEFIHNERTVQAYYGLCLTTDEFDAIKHRIGEKIIFTRFLLAYATPMQAFNSIKDNKDEKKKHKVVFEMNADSEIDPVNPFSEIDKDKLLFWFGLRCQIMKIELNSQKNETNDSYWLIAVNICPTIENNSSIEKLHRYYLDNLTKLNDNHHAFGRILMYKGLYNQAEKFLEKTKHFRDLAQLAIRQNQLERANKYLENLDENSHDANLLRAYVCILSSGENMSKGRTMLMTICSDATDKIIRAYANIALGFIALIHKQEADQALDHFKLGNDTLVKYLPDIHPDIAKSFIAIGYGYFLQKKRNETEKNFQKAFDIQKLSLQYKHHDFATSQSALAHYLSMQRQNINEALQQSECAYDILRRTFTHDYKKHPEIVATMRDIEQLRKRTELQVRNTLLDYI